MDSLNRAVDLVLKWPAGRDKDRQAIIRAMNDLADVGKRAQAVWEEYLKSPGKPGEKWSLMTWIGPERMRRLHEINLEAKLMVKRITDAAGPGAARFDQLDEDFIVMAYRQLNDGESGPDAAKNAVESMKSRIAGLGEMVTRIKQTPPAKNAGTGKSMAKNAKPKKSAKSAKKKATGKKAKKKAAKKAK